MKKIILLLLSLLFGISSFAIGDSTIVTSLVSSVGFISNQPNFTATISFAEDVNDIDLSRIQIINGYANNLRLGSTYRRNWTFTVWASYSQKRIGIVAPAGMITNYPANDTWNEASDTLWVYMDYTRPSIYFSSNTPNPTNRSNISVNISSSEYITHFALNAIQIKNARVDSFIEIRPNHQWKLDLTVLQDGIVNVYTDENVALDTAQNGNFASDTLSRRFDTTPPHATLSTMEDSLTNKTTLSFNLDFDEQIMGLDTSDFEYFNAKIDTLYESGTDSTHFIVQLSPLKDGVLWINLKSNAVTDLLSNNNPASNSLFFSYDGTVPQAILSSTSISPTADDTLYYTLKFSETVSDLPASGIYYSGGSLFDLKNEIPYLEWSFKIVNIKSQSIEVYLKSKQVTDSAGNSNLASNSISIETDHNSPSCTLSTYESNPTNKDSILIEAHFDKPVIDFSLNDLSLSGGSVNHFEEADSSNFSFYAFPKKGGTQMILSVMDSSYFDIFEHPGYASNFLEIQYDIDPPQVTVSSVKGNVAHDVFTVHFTFNEFVTNFIADSIHILNGNYSGVYESQTGYEWSASITPINKGNVSIRLGCGAAVDRAGNKAIASNTITVMYNDDIYPPTPTLTTDIPEQTNKTVIPIIITFDEEVINFTIGDIFVSNAAIAKFQQITANKSWSVNLVPLGDGWVTAEVKAHVCTDLSYNDNEASKQLAWKVDITVPSIKISTTEASPTKQTHIPLKFSFSEPVDSFDISDIKVVNGYISGFVTVIQNKIWSANLVPDSSLARSEGRISVFVPANVAFDGATNSNPSSDTLTLEYDGLAPTMGISNYLENDTSNYDTATVIINFSENVYGNILEKTSFTNCLVDNYVISIPNRQYLIRLKAKEEGVFGLRVGYGTVYDKVGNLNQPQEMALYYKIKNSSAINTLKNTGIKAFTFKNRLYIHYSRNLITTDNLKIVDLNGKQVFQKILFGKEEFQIFLPLKKGLYFLQIEENGHFYSQKIIIGN